MGIVNQGWVGNTLIIMFDDNRLVEWDSDTNQLYAYRLEEDNDSCVSIPLSEVEDIEEEIWTAIEEG